jgi:hypothetical protein
MPSHPICATGLGMLYSFWFPTVWPSRSVSSIDFVPSQFIQLLCTRAGAGTPSLTPVIDHCKPPSSSLKPPDPFIPARAWQHIQCVPGAFGSRGCHALGSCHSGFSYSCSCVCRLFSGVSFIRPNDPPVFPTGIICSILNPAPA